MSLHGIRSRSYLVHWEAGERPQFLTWRLADSVPKEVLRAWEDELILEKLNQDQRHRELARRIEAYLDSGHGSCVLRNHVAAKIVQDALIFHHGHLYDLREWSVLANHVHALLIPMEGVGLARLTHANKSYTSTKINEALGRAGTLWQPEYYDRMIRDADHFARVASYICWNPVKAKLCVRPEDWPYSSANPLAQGRLDQGRKVSTRLDRDVQATSGQDVRAPRLLATPPERT